MCFGSSDNLFFFFSRERGPDFALTVPIWRITYLWEPIQTAANEASMYVVYMIKEQVRTFKSHVRRENPCQIPRDNSKRSFVTIIQIKKKYNDEFTCTSHSNSLCYIHLF